MAITNCWKLFLYGVKIYHYENLIIIIEFLERLSQYCFSDIFHLIVVTQQKTYSPLIILMMGVQFLIAVKFIFTVVFLPPQRPSIFLTSLNTVLRQYLLDLRILPKEKNLEKEGDIKILLEVTVQRGCLI